MGNSSSSAQGSIYVKTDKPYYLAGSEVMGTVYLHLFKRFRGNQVILKIKGVESSHWTQNYTVHQNNQTHTRTRIHQGKNVFYSNWFVLFQSPYEFIEPGQYAFPFSFRLMNHLPSTFREEGTDFKALIRYKIKSELNCYSSRTKIKNTQQLIVRELNKGQLEHNMYGEMRVHAKEWCCCQRGHSQIKCFFQKNAYLPGQIAQIYSQIDNSQCQLAINNIECVFTKILQLRSSTGSQRIIRENLTQLRFQGLGPGMACLKEAARKYQLQLLNRRNNSPIQPTTSGQLVRCTYQLLIKANLSGCTCCVSDPSVKAYITIYSPQPINYGVVRVPEGWAPKQYQRKEVQITSNSLYGPTNKFQPVPDFAVPTHSPTQFPGQYPVPEMTRPY